MPVHDINSARDSAITYITTGDFAIDKAKAIIEPAKHNSNLLHTLDTQ